MKPFTHTKKRFYGFNQEIKNRVQSSTTHMESFQVMYSVTFVDT